MDRLSSHYVIRTLLGSRLFVHGISVFLDAESGMKLLIILLIDFYAYIMGSHIGGRLEIVWLEGYLRCAFAIICRLAIMLGMVEDTGSGRFGYVFGTTAW